MQNSKIEWTDHTLNFWWGCLKVSPGCEHCYAETLSKRVGRNIWGPAQTTKRWRTKGPWRDVLKWDKAAAVEGQRKRVFCQSMSDFFEDHLQLDEWRQEAFRILESLKWLDVQLLTKRPENVLEMVPKYWRKNWPNHIWIGTSVENWQYADRRIPKLLKIPAKIRFLSCEPLLGPINLRPWIEHLDWIIIGGESGPKARPFKVTWADDIIRQCRGLSIPAFVKQMGSNAYHYTDSKMLLKDPKGGDPTEWHSALRIREFPSLDKISIL